MKLDSNRHSLHSSRRYLPPTECSHGIPAVTDICPLLVNIRRLLQTCYYVSKQIIRLTVIFNCQTKTRLVKAYCTSFYGAELWDLSKNNIESIFTAWRTGIRRIWHLPNTTHSALIPDLCYTLPLLDMFYMRIVNVCV